MARSSPSTGLALLLLAAVVCASCLFQGAQATEYVPPKCSDAECAKKNTPCASYACGPDYKCSKVTYYPGKVCREAYGDCDVKEVCKDYDPYCPADEVKYKGHECRKAYGDCDVAEYCDGKNKTCPYDGVKDKTSKCRDSYGDCDEPEYCDGYSKKCPYDGVKNKTIKCRDSYGDCDEPEYCDGYSKECPYDGVKNKTIKCRDAYGDCDMPEYCDGKNKTCPYDMKKPYGKVCRPAKNKCDEPEKCDGKSPYCPKDDSKSGGYVKKCGTTCFVCGKDNKITVTTETLPNGKTQTKYDVYGCNPGECKEIEYLDEYSCHKDCVTGKCENGKDVSNVIFLSCAPYGAYPKCNKIEGGGCRY